MAIRFWIRKIEFRSGTTVNFNKDNTVVIVGPNNVGKSLLLRELYGCLQNRDFKGKIITAVEVEKEGSVEEFISYIEERSIVSHDQYGEAYYLGLGCHVSRSQAIKIWESSESLQPVFGMLANLVTTQARLGTSDAPNSIPLPYVKPAHPIHVLQRYDDLEVVVSELFRQAFGVDLIVHRNAGTQVPLYIGQRPTIEAGEDRVSISYLKKLERLPRLQDQGDGMRSFAGVLLNVYATTNQIVVIDEPEVFLHPPQARLLGKMLGKDSQGKKQLYLSPHNGDFLRGLLESNASNLKIIRVQRDGDVNSIVELDSEDVRTVWSDSLLRHSNVLDGLFHPKVVICEGDADCRFYAAVLDAVYEKEGQSSPDVLFIQCGGKHRMPVVVKALKKLNVSISVIADFDVLNAEHPLKDIYESLGGEWHELGKLWNVVKKAVDDKKPESDIDEAKRKIIDVVNGVLGKEFSKESTEQIKKLLKKPSPWTIAKEQGKDYIPSGQASRIYLELIEKLNTAGLFVVEVGHLECFDRYSDGYGPSWVNNVVEKDIKNVPELEEARRFVKKVVKN